MRHLVTVRQAVLFAESKNQKLAMDFLAYLIRPEVTGDYENSLVGIFRTNIKDGLILEANQRVIQMLGYSCAADVINQKSATEFYVDLGARQRMLAELQAKGEVHNFETQFRKRDGSAIWVLFSARMNVEEYCLEGVIVD